MAKNHILTVKFNKKTGGLVWKEKIIFGLEVMEKKYL